MDRLHVFEVGGLFIPGKTQYREAAVLEYTESGPLLLLAIIGPTAKEVEAVKAGKIELALYEREPVLWFLFKIHGFGPWSDAPFSIRLYDGRDRKFDWSEEIEDGMGLGLQIILVDAGTGIVKALRFIAMPTDFSREFRAAILRQLERPFSADEYNREISRIYANYSSDDLADRADIKCKLGEK